MMPGPWTLGTVAPRRYVTRKLSGTDDSHALDSRLRADPHCHDPRSLRKRRRKAVDTGTENARRSYAFNVLTDTTRNVGQQEQ